MKIVLRVILTLLVLAIVGCSSGFSRDNMDITSNYDEAAGFQNYKTWDYASYVGLGPFSAERAMKERLDARVKEALAARGLEYEPGNPDLRVGYFLAMQKVDAGEVSDYYVEFTPHFDQQLKTLDQGSLSIFVFDSKTGTMVWRATAEAQLDKGASLKQRKERFETVVGWLLEELP